MISIVVPFYNVLPYLEKCLKSLQRQTYRDFEVILIDDGSTDGGEIFSEAFCAQDDRFRLFHQDNAGVSEARNHGLRRCRGEIITFVDADDWVSDTFAGTIADRMGEADVLIFDAWICSDGKTGENHCWKQSRSFSGKDKQILLQQAVSFDYPQEYVPWCHGVGTVWGKAIRRSVLSDPDLRFDARLRMGEDALFMLYVLQRAERIRYLRQCLYYYRNDNVSVTRSFDASFPETQSGLVDAFLQFTETYQYAGTELEDAVTHRVLSDLYLNCKNYIMRSEKPVRRSLFLEEIRKERNRKALASRGRFPAGFRKKLVLLACERQWFPLLRLMIFCEDLARGVRNRLRSLSQRRRRA